MALCKKLSETRTAKPDKRQLQEPIIIKALPSANRKQIRAVPKLLALISSQDPNHIFAYKLRSCSF